MTEPSTVPLTGDALAFAPIHELAPRIAAGTLSPRDLTETCLARIGKADPKLHAFVAVYGEEALAAAEACEQAIRAGQRLGPLHGIPIALKDLCEMEGRITTGGSRAWAGRVSPVTATAVARLRAAGMVVVGKTHLVEFAYGSWGTNQHQGAPWNPWDLETHRVPGGSSSGSGVAVGAGLVPAAIGSDTGGSVRIPSSMSGIVGLKVTYGRISNHGVLMLSDTLDTLGPMVRSVEDAALLFAVLHGPDPADPATLAAPCVDPMGALKRGVAGLRIGAVRAEDLGELHPDVAANFRRAADTLADAGARVEEVALPQSFLELPAHTGLIIATEGYSLLEDVLQDERAPLDPHVRERLLAGRDVPAADYIRMVRTMRGARRRMGEFLADFDALVTPTTPIPAIPLAEVDERVAPLSSLTRAVNFLGLCALAVPSGLTAEGLPTSVQIIGQAFAEPTVLRIGWAYEQAAGTTARHPDLTALLG